MSSSYDAATTYNSLDDSTYDIVDLDAYCSLLGPLGPSPKPGPTTSVPGPRLKRYPKMRGHPPPSPAVVLPPIVTSAPAQSCSVPAKPNKGKGRQCPAPPPTPASPVDSQSSVSTDSVDLTPEQHLCLVQVLKRLDEWFAQGWEPGIDKSRLRALAEVFNSTESVAEGSLSNIRHADLAWRMSDSDGWEKSAGSSIMGAIDIQVTITKILFKDYRELLIVSFRSFLGQKEAELGDSGCPYSILGPPLLKEASRGDSKPNIPKRVRFQELDSAIRGACDVRSERNEGSRLSVNALDARVPTYDEACRSLAQHLAFISRTTYRQWLNFLFTLRESAPGTNTLHSCHATSPLPDCLFAPVIINDQLRYLLAGRGCLTDSHPLRRFRCFRCNSLGHWSPNHDRTCGSVYGGPAHSGVLPGSAC